MIGRALATAAALWATAALAQSPAPSLALDYDAPPQCPSSAALVAEVRRLRGELLAAELEPDVRAHVRLRPDGTRFSAEVETVSRAGTGRRTLDADTCQRAIEAVAVVLALALANPSAPLPPAPEPVPATVAVERPTPEPPGLRPFVEALGAARFGVLPSPMALAQLGGGVEWHRLRVEARVGLAGPSTLEGSTASANVESWLQASLGACVAVIDAAARLELCAALDAALLSARGRGLSDSRQGSALWLAALGGLTLRSQSWKGFSVLLDSAVGGALARPRFFVVVGPTNLTLYEAPILTGRFGLGLQWRW